MGKGGRISLFFPERFRAQWDRMGFDMDQVREIRLRVNRPAIVVGDREHVLPAVYGDRELEDIFRYLCHDSVYAYDEERRQGYMTVEGGHRIGLAGELVLADGRFIVKYVRYMNIRIAHELVHIAQGLLPYLYCGGRVSNTLIVSPPGIGKTTLLRDIIRSISDGCCGHRACNVGVVDERGEIAGAFRGSASLDCGARTDIVTGGSKKYGIEVLVRTFSPGVVAIDEIGRDADADAISYAAVSGCSVLATVHGSSMEDIAARSSVERLLRMKLIERFVILSIDEKMDRYFEVYDREGKRLCGRNLLQAPA